MLTIAIMVFHFYANLFSLHEMSSGICTFLLNQLYACFVCYAVSLAIRENDYVVRNQINTKRNDYYYYYRC